VRTFCFKTEELNKLNKYRNLLKQLSPNLRGRVADNLLKPIMNGMRASNLRYQYDTLPVDYLRDVTARLAMRVEHEAFAPDEQFGSPRAIYCLLNGVSLRMGVVLLQGALWGSDLLIEQDWLRTPHHCVAITHMIVQKLYLSDLKEGFALHPTEWSKLRRQSAKLTVCRCLVLAAKQTQTSDVLRRLAGHHTVADSIDELGNSIVNCERVEHSVYSRSVQGKHAVEAMAMGDMNSTLMSLEKMCGGMQTQMEELGKNQAAVQSQIVHLHSLFDMHVQRERELAHDEQTASNQKK
jgi:hypothetical protein